MKTIPLKEIRIVGRIRRTFDEVKLANLADSIARLGLLHAPILNDGVLVCGERRLKAISVMSAFKHQLRYQGIDIPEGFVPFTELGSSTVNTIMEAELEENLMREDLSVHEEAAARADLHRLRVSQNPSQTRLDTAVELSKPGKKLFSMDIRDALLIDEFADHPEVSKTKSKKDAMKVITRMKRDEHNASLAAEFQLNNIASPHTLIAADMIATMGSLSANTFDVICTDPPYGIDAQNFNAQEGITHVYND